MEEEVCTSSIKPERAKLQLSSSPPPNCAICLSDCDNKSFTDRCMHQFCFACLLRWSKVKAECPLCKQPFKSIIHTVRSNSDYEEFTVLNPGPSEEFNHEDIAVDFDPHYLYPFTAPSIPSPPARQRRFQYRTTLYLDPHEDIAIQQMLMSHPLTNTLYMPRRRLTRLIGNTRPANSLDFRHAIYQHNWWVNPASTIDITGRYRECSPQFFRENPAQRNRIGPWLHRELNALLNENGPHCLYVMSIINNLLLEYHVTSPEFKQRILPYFGDKTDHFIHEFHNFLRSPYDMIGYDRNLQYTQRIQNIELATSSSSSDSDSDVEVVNTQPAQIVTIDVTQTPLSPAAPTTATTAALDLTTNDVIVLTDTESDNSDVIYRDPTPPPIVTITDSDSDNNVTVSTMDNNIAIQQVNTLSPMESPQTIIGSGISNQTSVIRELVQYKKEDLSDNEPLSNLISENNRTASTSNLVKSENELMPSTSNNNNNTPSSLDKILEQFHNDIINGKKTFDTYKRKLKRKHHTRRARTRCVSTSSSSSSESKSESNGKRRSLRKKIPENKIKQQRHLSSSTSDSDSSPLVKRPKRSVLRKKRRTRKQMIYSSSSTSSSSSNSSSSTSTSSSKNSSSTVAPVSSKSSSQTYDYDIKNMPSTSYKIDNHNRYYTKGANIQNRLRIIISRSQNKSDSDSCTSSSD